jgi:hypothetical protein
MDKLPFELWYLVGILSATVLLALLWITRLLYSLLACSVLRVLLKHLRYSEISVLRLISLHVTYGEVLGFASFLAGNAICLAWKTTTLRSLSTQSASLFASNLAILLPSADILADTLRISLTTYRKGHSIVALVALVEMLLHVTLELLQNKWANNIVSITGILVHASFFYSFL